MKQNPELLDPLAALLSYPQEDLLQQVDACCKALACHRPEALKHLQVLRQSLEDQSLTRWQEEYVAAFDCNSACALEVGWHVYGESYQRGEFLGQMREQMRRIGIPESTELPDHLSHALQALGRSPEEEMGRHLRLIFRPAVAKIVEGLEKRKSLYLPLLKAVADVLSAETERATVLEGCDE